MPVRLSITAALADLPAGAERTPGPANEAFGAFTLRRLDDNGELPNSRERHTRLSRRLEKLIERTATMAKLLPDQIAGTETGLVSGSSYGCSSVMEEVRRQLVRKGSRGVDPIRFASATHSFPLSLNAIRFGIRGPCAALVSSEAAGLEALLCAADWLQAGRCERVLIAAYEDFGDPVAAHITAAGKPGAVNEAMALVLLEVESAALARGAAPLASIEGFGTVGRNFEMDNIVTCMRRACGRYDPEAAAACLATPRWSWDVRMKEHEAVESLDRQGLPSIAFKPRMGDCLGASGLIELALLLADDELFCAAPLWLINALDPRTGGIITGVAPSAREHLS